MSLLLCPRLRRMLGRVQRRNAWSFLRIQTVYDLRAVTTHISSNLEHEEELLCSVADAIRRYQEEARDFQEGVAKTSFVDVSSDSCALLPRKHDLSQSLMLLLALPRVPVPLLLRMATCLAHTLTTLAESHAAFLTIGADSTFFVDAAFNLNRAANSLFELAGGRAFRSAGHTDLSQRQPRAHISGYDVFYDASFGAADVLYVLRTVVIYAQSLGIDTDGMMLAHRLLDDARFQSYDFGREHRCSGRARWSLIWSFPEVLSLRHKAAFVAIEGAQGMQLSVQDAFFNALFDGPQDAVLCLVVRREHVLEDVGRQLMPLPPHRLRQQLRIAFAGEPGVDQGGIVKEFFQLLCRDVFADRRAFTQHESSGVVWFTPSLLQPTDAYLHEHGGSPESAAHAQRVQSHCALAGLVVGLAIYNGVLLETAFPAHLFSVLLGHASGPITDHLAILAEIDPVLARNLVALMTHDHCLELLCAVNVQCSDGVVREAPFFPGGEQVFVGQSQNERTSYAQAYAALFTQRLVNRQLQAFVAGLEVVLGQRPLCQCSKKSLEQCAHSRNGEATQTAKMSLHAAKSWESDHEPSVVYRFSPMDLEHIVCGKAIDQASMSAWREAAHYDGGYRADTPVVQWFWDWAVGRHQPETRAKTLKAESNNPDINLDCHFKDCASDDERARLLAFVTGCRRAPVGGLSTARLTIMRAAYEASNSKDDMRQLPTAHTCFNYLVLPEYPDRSTLIHKLRAALEHCEGFGLQ